jgi:hypothetical protein
MSSGLAEIVFDTICEKFGERYEIIKKCNEIMKNEGKLCVEEKLKLKIKEYLMKLKV